MITAYVAKGGLNFNLFSNDGDPNSGVYSTPTNPSGNPAGLSHLTFYDAGDNGGGPVPSVPEPSATGALVLLGLGGLKFLKKKSQA